MVERIAFAFRFRQTKILRPTLVIATTRTVVRTLPLVDALTANVGVIITIIKLFVNSRRLDFQREIRYAAQTVTFTVLFCTVGNTILLPRHLDHHRRVIDGLA